jgi:hypothetical protein
MKIRIEFKNRTVSGKDKTLFTKLFPTIKLLSWHTDSDFWLVPEKSDFDLEVDDKTALETIHSYLENWSCIYSYNQMTKMKTLTIF